jgi:toxin ParE1/3/4
VALELIYRPTAQSDLAGIYDWIADDAGPRFAFAYIGRIQAACRALLDFPGRGTPRDELEPGLRSVAFERRATIFYRLTGATVEIVHVLQAGRDVERAFEAD